MTSVVGSDAEHRDWRTVDFRPVTQELYGVFVIPLRKHQRSRPVLGWLVQEEHLGDRVNGYRRVVPAFWDSDLGALLGPDCFSDTLIELRRSN